MIDNSKRLLFWALVIAAIPRLVLWFMVLPHPDRITVHDAPDYINPSYNMLEGHGFSQQVEEPYTADTRRTPAYPVFLVMGMTISSSNWLAVVTFFQIIINLATILLLYLLALRFVSERLAFWSACFLGLSLGHICYSVLIMSDVLFAFAIMLVVYLLFKYRDEPSWKMAVLIGLILGIATLIRPVALPLPLLLSPFIIFAAPKDWKGGLIHTLLILILSIAVVMPWLMRNEQILGYKSISTVPMRNMYVYNAAMVSAHKEGRPPLEVQMEYGSEVVEEVDGVSNSTQGLLYQQFDQKGKEIIFGNFGLYLYLHIKSSFVSFFPNINDLLELTGVVQGQRGTLSVLHGKGTADAINHYFGGKTWALALVLPFAVFLAWTYLLAALGLWRFYKIGLWGFLLVTGLIVYFLFIGGPVAVPRFRIPAQPFICLLAVMGWPVFTKIMARQTE